jgi:D-alanyl-D-alanine carboxypeptidase
MRIWNAREAAAGFWRPKGRLAVAAATALSLLTCCVDPAFAAGRHASLVVDANTGRVLHAHADDELRHPASLAKMMTLYIVFELMQQGRLTPATRITMSETAAGTAPSKLGLPAGSEIRLIDAVKALITKSANDVAVAVAEHISGSEQEFARLMTRKARAIGMHATVFKNANGLPDSDQVTTARDMITLALHLGDDFPRWYQLFSTRSFAYNGRSYRNHNTLLGTFDGTDGIKTGYTAASGFNLVASVRRNGKHVIGVVFGGSTASSRNAYMRALLSRALAKASTHKTRKPAPVVVAANSPREHANKRPMARQSVSQRAPSEDRNVTAPAQPTQERQAEAPQAVRNTPINIARVRRVLVVAPTQQSRRDAEQTSAAVPAAENNEGGGQLAAVQSASATANPWQGFGAAPSTLQAQAARLARGEAAIEPASMPARFEVPQPNAAKGEFAIQVGAFSSESEAQRQLHAARSRASDLLAGSMPLTQPVQLGGRQLYRARFLGFDARTASSTCFGLRRLGVDCLVARPE